MESKQLEAFASQPNFLYSRIAKSKFFRFSRSIAHAAALIGTVGVLVGSHHPFPVFTATAVSLVNSPNGVVTASATFRSSVLAPGTIISICARDEANHNVDFPHSAPTTIGRIKKTAYSGTRHLEPMSIRYWPCAKTRGVWINLAAPRTFFVPQHAPHTTGPPTKKPVPNRVIDDSPATMPVGDLPGWKQTFTENFLTDQKPGAFPGVYARQWMSYDGFADTFGHGVYSQNIISAHDGYLDLYLHTADGQPRGAAPVPLIGGRWGGQKYGRFSVRMKSDPLDGYGAGILLWSDTNTWSDGEIDFPEGRLTGTANAANHCLDDPPKNCFLLSTMAKFSDWHTYTIDWTPKLLSYEIDGVTVGSTVTNIPSKSMHWVMQQGTNGIPTQATAGHLLIDWATIYAYKP